MQKSILAFAAIVAITSTMAAQDPCLGNGLGASYIGATPAKIGGTMTVAWGNPNAPFGTTVLVASDLLGPVVHPIAGTLCLDINSPGFTTLFSGALDGTGTAVLSGAIPAIPALVNAVPIFIMAVTVDPTVGYPYLSIPKTIPVFFENADSYHPTGNLSGGARALHTAVATGAGANDNRTDIFVAGGGNGTVISPIATNTTEIWDALTRTFTAGPTMLVERALHTATRLNDGRILICGGTDTAGNVHNSFEFYDPSTNSLTVGATTMVAPRAGHAATLLANGKVLVTGGVSTFVGGGTNLVGVLATSQNTGEVFDPATNTWSAATGTMASGRFLHTQTLLANGNVVIVAGINGGQTILTQGLPTYTNTCSLYNPTTNALSPTGNIGTARAVHAATRLSSGNVIVTGGLIAGTVFNLFVPQLTTSVQVYNVAAGTWSSSGALPNGIAGHTQNTLANGDALIHGGFNSLTLSGTNLILGATANAGRHNGTSYTAQAQIGTNAGIPGAVATPMGSHTATRMHDGSFVLIGGSTGPTTYQTATVYTN